MHYLLRFASLLTRKGPLTLLTLLLTLGMLYFGLRPLSWPNFNQVSQIEGGLTFHTSGLAYVDGLPALSATGDTGSFSICLTLTPGRQHPGFRSLLMLHDGSDNDQLTISQWNSSIIAMNGDDYSYRRKLPRIKREGLLTADTLHTVGLSVGAAGSRLYGDGALQSDRQGMRLTLPTGKDRLLLTLGNSVYGNASWEGVLHYLAIYDRALSDEEMTQACAPANPPPSMTLDSPRLLYTFSGMAEGRIPDLSGNGQDLLVPERPMALRQVFLASPMKNFHLSRNLVIDIILNFLGFIPLAAALHARLRLSTAFSGWYPAQATILICTLLSLAIELAQGWLPNRSSSVLDLILNSSGAAAGVLLSRYGWDTLTRFVAPVHRQP